MRSGGGKADVRNRAGITGRVTRKAKAMKAFLTSDLFLRFLGGFAIGVVGMVMLAPDEQPMFGSTAVAATSTHDRAL